MKEIEKIEKTVGLVFRNKELLINAITHTSFINENLIDYTYCNERLEFLGDAILELAVRLYLYERFRDQGEDVLTEKKKSLTNQHFLARLARDLHLDQFLRLGRGETFSGGPRKDSILADALEAMIGAIYLDRGFQDAAAFFFNLVPDDLITDPQFDDPKSRLNSWASKNRHLTAYRITKEEGEPHSKTFHVEILIDSKPAGKGKGRSKKMAEQEAARKALKKIGYDL